MDKFHKNEIVGLLKSILDKNAHDLNEQEISIVETMESILLNPNLSLYEWFLNPHTMIDLDSNYEIRLAKMLSVKSILWN